MTFESVNYNGEVLIKSYLQESIKKESKYWAEVTEKKKNNKIRLTFYS